MNITTLNGIQLFFELEVIEALFDKEWTFFNECDKSESSLNFLEIKEKEFVQYQREYENGKIIEELIDPKHFQDINNE